MRGVAEAISEAGWAVRELPSGDVVGRSGRLVIRPDEKLLGDETVFELLDEELNMKAYGRLIPTPELAAELIDEYGSPAEIADAAPGKVPMVPPHAEGSR